MGAEGVRVVPDVRELTSEVRKPVTVLFADLVESSRLSLPSTRKRCGACSRATSSEQSAVVRRHGGTVEKYIGDAVMAVFGVPILHEDDALRAVRAAAEMRATLATLNDELEAALGRPPGQPDRRQHRRGGRGRSPRRDTCS